MAKFTEMSQKVQLAVVLGVLVFLTAGLYFAVFKSVDDQNQANQLKLEAKKAENDKLRPYERNLPELNRTTEALQMQLENLQRIVPDEKEADQFLHAMQNEANRSGIEIRRYTSKPVVSREFYTEVPFDLELDGPYYSMLSFFEHVGRLERIINIGGLKVYSIKGAEKAPVKTSYKYAAHESVVATCEAKTFFSHDSIAVAVDKKSKVAKQAAK
jgi:type IV pilus assembly protein PilO